MYIGDLSRRTGLSVDTLRYYEKIGLLAPALRDRGGRRVYDAAALDWIAFLTRLRATGMGIADMLRYAELRRRGDATASERRRMIEAHRARILADVAALTATAAVLDDKIETYRAIEAGLAADRPDGDRKHDTLATRTDHRARHSAPGLADRSVDDGPGARPRPAGRPQSAARRAARRPL